MARFDVFLSHNSVDKPWARQLKAGLGRYGLLAWLDEDEIRPGDLIVDALELAPEQSQAVAIMVSPEAMASGWVKEEYNRAVWLAQDRGRSLQLIPVILRTAELPGFLQSRSWVDFRDEAGGDDPVDDTKYLTHDPRPAGKQEPAAGDHRCLLQAQVMNQRAGMTMRQPPLRSFIRSGECI